MPSSYPARPVLGVGAIALHEGGVLLVRRARPPRQGRWSLPGGRVELGETLSDALRREVEEETGWTVAVERLVDFFEYVERDPEDRVVYHYVVADFCCRYRAGRLRAGSDVSDARLVPVDEIENYDLNSEATAMIRKALESA